MATRNSINQALEQKWVDDIVDNVDYGIELHQAYIICNDKVKREKLLSKMLNYCSLPNDIISVMRTVSDSENNKNLAVIDIQSAVDKFNEFYLKDIEKATKIEDIKKVYNTYGIYVWATINSLVARKMVDFCTRLSQFKEVYDFARRFGESDYAEQKWDSLAIELLNTSTEWKNIASIMYYVRQDSDAQKNALERWHNEISRMDNVYEAKEASGIEHFDIRPGFAGYEIAIKRWEVLFLEKLPELNSLKDIKDFFDSALVVNNCRTKNAERLYLEKWGEVAIKAAEKCNDFEKLWEIYKDTHYNCKSVRIKTLQKLVQLCSNEEQAKFLYKNTDNIFDTNRHIVAGKLVELTSDVNILQGIYIDVLNGFFPQIEKQVMNKLALVLNEKGYQV